MTLSKELQDKLNQAQTLEEKKEILIKEGIDLTDKELESVSGGLFAPTKLKFPFE